MHFGDTTLGVLGTHNDRHELETGIMHRAVGEIFLADEGEDKVESGNNDAAKGHGEKCEWWKEPVDLSNWSISILSL